MSATHKTQAIILKKRELLEKDIQITLLTEEFGKLKVIAKGIKSLTSRRAPHIQTGHLINVILSPRNHTFFLQQTELISGFTSIKNDSVKLNYVYTFFFILDKILPEEQKEEEIYKLTKSFLVTLGKTDTISSSFFRDYVQKLLMKLGYLQDQKPLTDLIRQIEEIIDEKVPLHAII